MNCSKSSQQGDGTRAGSNARIHRFLMRVPVALAQLGSDGTFLNINDRFVQLFGYTLDDLRTVDDWWPRAYPDPAYRQEVIDVWAAAVQKSVLEGTDIPAREYSITCKNGEVKLVEVSGVMLPDELIVTLFDVTERQHAEQTQKRLNRDLRAITGCNQALLRAQDEQALLDAVCRIICEATGYPEACVAYAEHDAERSIRMVARNGVDAGFIAGIPLTWADRNSSRGPLGEAIWTGHVVEVPDLAASDPLAVPWRERALALGYRSAVTFPLRDNRQLTFGALLICSNEANAFTEEEVRLLEGLANDLAFGITTLRVRVEKMAAEMRLAASEQLFRALVENSPDPISRYDRKLRRVYLNPAICKLFAIPLDSVLGTTPRIHSPLADPERYMACLQQVIDTAQELCGEFAYRSANGEMRWSSVRFTPEFEPEGSVTSVLAISHDITERIWAEVDRKEHLRFLESLDRVNRAIQSAESLEQLMNDVLMSVLGIFECDRAFLLYPCDPEAESWNVPMECTTPEYPGVLAQGLAIPMDPGAAATLRELLDASGPCRFGPGTDLPLPGMASAQFGFQSLLSMAIYPKTGKPWQFGLHQCSHARMWTDQEVRLFEEIGRRLSDGLSSVLTARDLRASQERFRLVFENSPLPIFEEDFSAVRIRLDQLETRGIADIEAYLADHPEIVRECAEKVRIVDFNSAAQDLHHAANKEILQRGLQQTFLPESYEAFRRELSGLARGETEMVFDCAVQTLDGDRREVTVYFAVCPGYEQSLGKVLVSLIDITERKQAEDRMRLAASVFANTQEAILISDARNRIIDVNPAFTRLTSYDRAEVLGRDPAFLGAGRQNSEFFDQMWRAIASANSWQGELWNRRKDGEEFAAFLSIVAVKDEMGKLQHYVGAFTDISVLKAHESDLDRIAHYDVLTGVPNRRLLSDRLEQAIARSRRLGKNLAVCYLDLDGFKPVNDQFGHQGGDFLLVEIAHRLQSMSRADDTIARLGGDEFVLLWNDIGDEAECFQALERILDQVSAPILLDGVAISISASIGVTLYPDDHVDADSLLRHADHAMYSAKQLGKNRYQLFDSRLERQITSRVEFLAKVERALDAGQFVLHYQPKVDCVTGRLIGVEALIRWNDPILGMVGPKEFLPLIENDNLAFQMGRWVMEQAVWQARSWHETGIEVPISINIFPRHLNSTLSDFLASPSVFVELAGSGILWPVVGADGAAR